MTPPPRTLAAGTGARTHANNSLSALLTPPHGVFDSQKHELYQPSPASSDQSSPETLMNLSTTGAYQSFNQDLSPESGSNLDADSAFGSDNASLPSSGSHLSVATSGSGGSAGGASTGQRNAGQSTQQAHLTVKDQNMWFTVSGSMSHCHLLFYGPCFKICEKNFFL